MKRMVELVVLSTAVLSQTALAEVKVIYGDDNRVEVYQATPFQQKLAQSAASMVSKDEIKAILEKPGFVRLTQTTLKEWLDNQNGGGDYAPKLMSKEVLEFAKRGMSFCSEERFIDQPNPAMCSGFLIAPDLLVTAGHCAEGADFCSDYRWIFGFSVDEESQKAGLEIKEEDVYKCKKVVSNTLANSLGLDYAVVQLDRRVVDRAPLEIRNDGQIKKDTDLMVIGSPSGLPLKVAAGANVRTNTHPFYFSANLDSFQGNSGSAVFDVKTGIVEGILVRGENDFVPNIFRMCIESNQCGNNECRGEDVTRLTAIPEIGIQRALNYAAFTGDIENLEKLLKLNTWVDFYTKDGESALMKAARGGENSTAKALLAKGADVNLQDALGNSAIHHLASILTPTKSELLETLTKAGANLDQKNNNGETAITIAAKKLNVEGVRMLIALGADKNAVDANGESVLFPFTQAQNKKFVKELIKSGVNPHVVNKSGKAAVQYKQSKGKLLLKSFINKIRNIVK